MKKFAFLAAVLSALACAVLWGHQRYVGLRSGSVALITQSIDSRNHVFVALGVTARLAATLLHFSLLDSLVGLAVAILILKSALELGIEVLHSLGEDNMVRATGNGLSAVVDYQGRVLASQDYFTTDNGIMLATLPLRRATTLYSRIGDLFAYLCAAGLVFLAAWALLRQKHPATVAQGQPA